MVAPFFGKTLSDLRHEVGFHYRGWLRDNNRKGEVYYVGEKPDCAVYRLMAADFQFPVVLDITTVMERSLVLEVFTAFPPLEVLLGVGQHYWTGGTCTFPYKFQLRGRVEEGCFRFRRILPKQHSVLITVQSGLVGYALMKVMLHLSQNLAALKALGEEKQQQLRDFVECVLLREFYAREVKNRMDSILGVDTRERGLEHNSMLMLSYWRQWCQARMEQFPVSSPARCLAEPV